MKFYWTIGIYISTTIFTSCRKVNEDCNQNAFPNAPKQEWFLSYNGTEQESHGHYILSCSDGGYLQIGETGNLQNSSKILIVKTNSEGNLLWKKEISEGNHNLGNSVIELSDGYLICGAKNKNSSLIKLDKQTGAVLFDKSVDNGGTDAFEHIVETANGFIAVGYKEAQDELNTFFTEGIGYLTFLNHQGIKTGELNLNHTLSHAYRIASYNNEYFISGLTSGANDYGLIKLDSSGNLISSFTFGGSSMDHCFGMDISDDGYIFLTGHTLSGTENWDTYTIKINPQGQLVWESIRGNPRGFKPKYIHDEAWDIKSTLDGGCLVIAGTGDEYSIYNRKCGNDGDRSNIWHVYLLKYDANGNLEWQKTYGGDGDWAGEALDITQDGGIIIAVDDGSFGFLKIEDY